jgi:VCBS repeat protein/ASPIC/UnbV protein
MKLVAPPAVAALVASALACSQPAGPPAPASGAPVAPGASKGAGESGGGHQGPGTRKMAARLAAIARDTDPEDDLFMSRERAEILEARLKSTGVSELLDLEPKLAQELLQGGRTVEAIEAIEKTQEFVKARGIALNADQRTFLRDLLGVCYLRLGEQENCLQHHTTESCLLPIQGSGIHLLDRGSRGAIKVLTGQLEEFGDDLKARWLLNIAYMTLGEYPGKVPKAWLIPPAVFESEAKVKRFTDVAGRLHLDVDDLSGGVIVDDFDNDGLLDVVASASGLESQLRYFHHEADGTFVERTDEASLTGELGGLNILQADYNNDGFIDILVLRGAWLLKAGLHPNSLLRNNGDGTFEDVTEAAGLLSLHPTQTAAWLDYDGDGWLDLFIGNESRGDLVHPCELYHNNHDGTFTDVAAASGVAVVAFVKGVVAGDFNNDGRPDLYLSCLEEPNKLLRNDGPAQPGPPPSTAGGAPAGRGGAPVATGGAWRFTDVAAAAGVTEPLHSFPTWFFDYDNDGWPDLYVSGFWIKNVGEIAADLLGLPNQAERPRLYHNQHDGTFKDATRAAHLDRVLHAMGANFGDIDNDGWLDFYLGTGNPDLATIIPNRMFRNAGGRFFQDVTTAAGVGHLQKGHGIAFADIDNDGDQDIYEVMGGALEGDNYRNVLYENPGYGNHWITLKLEGVRANRAAIGARIRVTFSTPAGTRSVFRTVGSGGSFGASPLRQEIGLGNATAIREVRIDWPGSGTTQTLGVLPLDHFYLVREGEAQARPLALPRVPL